MRIISLAFIWMVASSVSALALQQKYIDHLEERAGWYDVKRTGSSVTVNSKKSNLWKIYLKVGDELHVLQRNPDKKNGGSQWYVHKAPITPGSTKYLLSHLSDDLVDITKNSAFTLNINGKKTQFVIDPKTLEVTFVENGVTKKVSPKIKNADGTIKHPKVSVVKSTSTNPDTGENSDQHESASPVNVDNHSQNNTPATSGSNYQQQQSGSISLGNLGGSVTDASGGTSSSGGFGTQYPAGSTPAAAACVGNYKLAWRDPLTALDMGKKGSQYFNGEGKSKWKVVRVTGKPGSKPGMMNGLDRLQLGAAPDGRPSIENLAPKGEVQAWAVTTDLFGPAGVEAVRLATDIYVPQGFVWGAGQKLALGIWIGGQPNCMGGGCAPENQDGIAVRNVHNDNYGPRIYSYHLNRTRDRVENGKRQFGQVGRGMGKIPRGKWVTLELEVVLNDMGKANGYIKMYMNGVAKDEMKGLVFRDSAHNWKIRGLHLNDMWGGTEENPDHYSPSNQRYWYSNYRAYTAGSCGN